MSIGVLVFIYVLLSIFWLIFYFLEYFWHDYNQKLRTYNARRMFLAPIAPAYMTFWCCRWWFNEIPKLLKDAFSRQNLDKEKVVFTKSRKSVEVQEIFQGISSKDIRILGEVLPKPFRVDRIIIPAEVAQHFLSTNIKVDRYSHFYSVGCLPAMVFSDESTVIQPDLNVLGEGSVLTLSVTCQSGNPKTFRVIVEGHHVGDEELKIFSRRRALVGLGSTLIQPKSSAFINVRPEGRFVPDQLVVSSSLSTHFKVVDFKVGKCSQEVLFRGIDYSIRRQGVPASYFSEIGSHTIKMDMANSEMFISVTVENISDRPRNFQGAIAGEIIE